MYYIIYCFIMNTYTDKELNEDIDLQTKNINNVDDIKSIINLKNDIYKKIYLLNKHIRKLEKLIILIDNKLAKKCNHDWIIDHSYFGEHTQYMCSVCSLYK